MSKQAIFKEGTLVRIKPKCEHLYKKLTGTVGIVEKYVTIAKPTYTRYFVVVRFFGIDHDYRMTTGVLEVVKNPDQLSSKNSAQAMAQKAIEDNKNLFPDATPVSEKLLQNVDLALNAAAARIKARAELRAKAEQERQKNSVTIHVPYTRIFRVAENSDEVRAKLRHIHSLLLAGQKVTPEQIVAIQENFDECQKMIYEIASYAVTNARRVNQ
jgi:hypothetical protein